MHKLLILSLVSVVTCYGYQYNKTPGIRAISTLYRWKQIDYQYPTEQQRNLAIGNG